jgi:hypothetical protein
MKVFKYSFVLFCIFLGLSGCHFERYVVKSGTYTNIKRHTLLTTRYTDRKLDIPVYETIEKKEISLTDVNFNSYPKNYIGFATVKSEDSDWILNLVFDSAKTLNDSLFITGKYSGNNKRDFEDVELVVPIREMNEGDIELITDDSLVLKSFLRAMYVYSVSASDSILENTQDSLLDSTMTIIRDTLFYDELLESRLEAKDASVEDSMIVLSQVDVLRNDEDVFLFSARLEYEGQSIEIVSQSDPLPLVPIIIAAVAGGGIYAAKDYLKKKGIEAKEKLTAYVDQYNTKDKKSNE